MKKDKYSTPHTCPVCGKYEFEGFGSFEICEVCGWEDDPVQEKYPDEAGGANQMSLNEHRAAYNSGWRPDWLEDDDEREK